MTDKLAEQRSLPQRRKGFGVAASPFNGVKFDLAIILIVAVLLLLVHAKLVADSFTQLLMLGGYGVAAMAWLMFRTRSVLRSQRCDVAAQDKSGADGISRSGAE